MRFNFENEKYNRGLDKRLFFNLTSKEKEIYSKLKKKASAENIIISIGDVFSVTDYKNMDKEGLFELLSKAKSESVVLERKMDAAEDILTSIKESKSNPKMIFKLFFGNNQKIEQNPYWDLTRTLYSILGAKMFHITKSEKEWLNTLRFKNKYASEEEIIDPLFTIIDTKEGHELIEHLVKCKNTICSCVESINKIDELIHKAKEYKKEIEIGYWIYDSLLKENPQTTIGLIDKCMDIYWITKLFYILKNGKINVKLIRSPKNMEKNNSEKKEDEQKKNEQ